MRDANADHESSNVAQRENMELRTIRIDGAASSERSGRYQHDRMSQMRKRLSPARVEHRLTKGLLRKGLRQ
jgi:hypothetical protein